MTTTHHSLYTYMSFEIVFTRIEMSWPTDFWELTLHKAINDLRIFSSLFPFQITLGISPSSVHSAHYTVLTFC